MARYAATCLLLALPQELQDIILDLACPQKTAAPTRQETNGTSGIPGYVERGWLDEAENARQPGPFASPKILEFLVSKKFFPIAAKT